MSMFVNMRVDYSFKKTFEDKELLKDFLNDILDGERTVASVEPRNPEWLPVINGERKAIVDVYCVSNDGTQFIVEMQNADQEYFRKRALFYDAFCLTRQGERGRSWEFDLLPVVSIFFLNFSLTDKPVGEYRTDVGLMDMKTGELFHDTLREIFIELPKFHKMLEDCQKDYDCWIYIIKNMDKMEYYPFPEGSKFDRLLQAGRLANYTAEEREQYDYALKVFRDNENSYNYAIKKGLKEGMEKGLEQGMKKGMKEGMKEGMKKGLKEGMEKGIAKGMERGIQKGITEGRLETARNMKSEGISMDVIAKCTGLSIEEIEQL